MRQVKLLIIILACGYCSISNAQQCKTDSNFYSIKYSTPYNVSLSNGIITSQNELVALGQNTNQKSSFVSKFTAQGNVLWSNEYIPDYPYVSWLQMPWYTETKFTGIQNAADSNYYIFGSSMEHGKTINNVEDPPTHQVGLLLKIDKYGKCIDGRYFGNWRTEYAVTGITELSNGNQVVFLRSQMPPFRSKVACVNLNGDIIWGDTFEPSPLYKEITEFDPLLKQLSNGNVVIMSQMSRSIDDTIHFPFLDVIVPAPLVFFNILILDSKDGHTISNTSFECAALAGSNVNANFLPQVKSITELPNGNISFCADVYWATEKGIVFYDQHIFSRRAISFITDKLGIYQKLITYRPAKGSGGLQSVWQTGVPGEQVLLMKDSSDQQLILFAIDADGKVEWTRGYKNPVPTSNSKGVFLEKKNGGYSIFESDASLKEFQLLITNNSGNDSCAEIPAVSIVAEDAVWPYPIQKVQYIPNSFDLDFRYAGFHIVQNNIQLSQDTYCKYQFECCKDFIDSLKPHNVSICEGESYTLPDNSTANSSGTYYQTLKSKGGCDSVVFYNLKIIKSPSHLAITHDTCLDNGMAITINATCGYESYLWNNQDIGDSSFIIQHPGNYSVKVTNVCGSKSDTTHVYDKCDFPIYFPTAFSPNGDFINDVLKVPELNINKLIRLRVYNRFGQIVFSTRSYKEGWDGRFKGIEQPVGAYVYLLEMQGLSGKKANQKGTFMLIR